MNEITCADPMKNPIVFQASINMTVLLMSNIPLRSSWIQTKYRTWSRQLLCHSTTLIIEILCPISTLNQQFTNIEQTHIQCSLHSERWKVACKDWASALHYPPHGRVSETVATDKELTDLWKLEKMDGIPPFVMSWNCF